ncbi:hypothetical protein Tco_1291380 [Tanacetum coccineum]
MPRKSFDTLADNLHDVMVETLPTMVDKHIKEQVMKQVPEQVRNQVPVYVAEGLILERYQIHVVMVFIGKSLEVQWYGKECMTSNSELKAPAEG